MAALTIDSWALQEITLDYANQFVPDVLIANANDASGRGIDLYITKNGAAMNMTGTKVYLVWRHENGNQDITRFTEVSAASGHFKVYYPNAMMRGGTVLARIAIYIGEASITGSRDFRIMVEPNPINEDEAMSDESLTIFSQAVIDLNGLQASVTAAETARAAAEGKRASAETARASAEAARLSEESARVIAESGRATAVSAALASASSATQAAQTASARATQAAQAAETAAGMVAEVDAALSATSIHPVQNKAVHAALAGKAAKSHTHAPSDLSVPVPLSKGGTGAATAQGARAAIGADDASNISKGVLDAARLPAHTHAAADVTGLADLVYPVGSIYMSVSPASPATLFGGTWAKLEGRMLIGASSSYPLGSTGGSASHTPVGTVAGHVLTVGEMPSHRHAVRSATWAKAGWQGTSPGAYMTLDPVSYFGSGYAGTWQNADNVQGSSTPFLANAGGGGSHNHGFQGSPTNTMPPYLSVHMWQRTA